MLYHFKQSVHLGGKDYALGNQEVDEKGENDPTFLKYVGLGLIVEPDAQMIISAKTPKQRAQELFDKLVAKKAPKVSAPAPVEAPVVEPVAAPVEAPVVEAAAPEAPKPEVPEKQDKKKKK